MQLQKVFKGTQEKRLTENVGSTLEETQFGFKPKRGVKDVIFVTNHMGVKPVREV